MKHYYNDDGILDYVPPDEIIFLLLKFTPKKDGNGESTHCMRQHVRSLVIESASELVYEYDIHKSFSGLGGCKSLEEWKEEKESSPLQTVLKQLLFDFIGQGYLYNEFMLAAWAAICNVQMEYALSGASTEGES